MSDPERLRLLVELLRLPSVEVLRRLDFENLELGSFIKDYVGPPPAEELAARSSIREDTVIRELSRLLSESDSAPLNILDACCGVAGLADRIIQALGPKAGRIAYWAVDRDTACIETVRARQPEFAALHSITILQRELHDLVGIEPESIHLIVLNNVLHEIPPREFPQMFDRLNGLLEASVGRLCIVDMETLPEESPEAIAITWTGAETEELLRAGGLSPEVTIHDKSIRVYQAHVKRIVAPIDKVAMRIAIRRSLEDKLRRAVAARRHLDAHLLTASVPTLRRWLVLTGTIARCAEELLAM